MCSNVCLWRHYDQFLKLLAYFKHYFTKAPRLRTLTITKHLLAITKTIRIIDLE